MSRHDTTSRISGITAACIAFAGALSWMPSAFGVEQDLRVACTSSAVELLNDESTSGELDELVRFPGCHATEGTSCDWITTISEGRMLGTQRRLIEISASHRTGSGAWGYVVVFDCETPKPQLAFEDSFLNGVAVAEATPSELVLLGGAWADADARCCPSAATRNTYVWQASSGKYVLSQKVEVPKSAMEDLIQASKPAQPQPQPQPQPQAAGVSPAGSRQDLRTQLSDPAARAEFRSRQIQAMRWGFPDLGLVLHLDRAEVDRLLGVLVDASLRGFDEQQPVVPGGPPLTPATGARPGAPTTTDAIAAEFGPAVAKRWKSYLDSLPARGYVRNAVTAAAQVDAPLSQQVRQRLVEVYTRATRDAQAAMNQTEPSGAISPTVPTLGVGTDRVAGSERIIALLEKRNAFIRQAAREFLSEAQLAVVDEQFADELRTHREFLATARQQRDAAANSAR